MNRQNDAQAIERSYAHFHRVLAALLETLTKGADVTWLGDSGHELTGDYNTNVYRPAVYKVENLDPYRAELIELNRVQSETLELAGREKPGRNLLPPLHRENVTHVRLSRYTGQTGRTVSKDTGLKRLAQLEEVIATNLLEFEQYATRHDPARRTLELELKELRKAIRLLEESKVTQLREIYQQTVNRPYVYFMDGSSEQMHMRNTGLIAAGPDLSVDWRTGPRRTRSDKIRIEPLVSAGALQFYDLDAWESARAR